jgi:hypothetical protein
VYKKIVLYSSFLLLLVSGCMQQKKIKPELYRQYQEVIAKYSDLPDAPFQAQVKNIVTSAEHHEQIQIFYTTSMPMIDVIAFYEQQMERLGWELIGQSDIHDCVLCYSKPQQFCTIVMYNNSFSIYVGSKKGA